MTRLLVIDDDAAVLRVLALGLRTRLDDVEVVVSGSGREGLRLLDEQPFDLVITDILMPDVEGLAVIEHINRHHAELPCVATSGGSSKMHLDVLTVARALGARATLFKPVVIDDLVRVVRGLLDD